MRPFSPTRSWLYTMGPAESRRTAIPAITISGKARTTPIIANARSSIRLTNLVPREALLPSVPNAISFEKYPELRKRFVDLLSLSTADTNTTERLGSLLCCLPDVPMPEGSGYENVFRVTIVEFLDRFNFCLGNVKRSCVHFVTPEGRIVPFDTYNTFYRPGAAGNARLAAERVR